MDPKNDDCEETSKFLWTIANRMSTTYPAASRYYISCLERMETTKIKKQEMKPHKYCKHCGSLWVPGNHKIRLLPLPPTNSHLKKLLKIEKEEPWKLNRQQKKKLKKLRESHSKIVYTCNTCFKKTTFPGFKKFKEKKVSSPEPKLKVKPKKGDLNAGLFIPLSTQDVQRTPKFVSKTVDTAIPEKTKDPLLKPKLLSIRKPTAAAQETPCTLFKPPPSKKPTKKKQSKSLLAQISKQEQNGKTKKNGLSSFLLSL